MRESRAVLLLLGLAVLGHAARALFSQPTAPPGELLGSQPSAGLNPAQLRARADRVARPLGSGEQLDLNAAPAEEIARLPRIGMSLAKRIVAERIAKGLFRGPGDLERVPGIGPGLLKALAGRVRFGGVSGANSASETGAANPRTAASYRPRSGSAGKVPVDLNLASEAELVALPGIGLVRAQAILAYRRKNGPFAGVSDLRRVPGFSQALVSRLTPLLQVQ